MKNKKNATKIIISTGFLLILIALVGPWAFENMLTHDDEDIGELVILKPIDSLLSNNTGNDAKKPTITSIIKPVKKGSPNNNSLDHLTKIVSNIRNSHSATGKMTGAESTDDINKLKGEIEKLLRNKSTDADLRSALAKIDELEQKVNKLVDKNSDVEKENKRLFSDLRKFSADRIESENSTRTWPVVYTEKATDSWVLSNKTNLNSNSTATINEKKEINQTENTLPTAANLFKIEDIRLSAITVIGNNEIETYLAYQTDKLVGSVALKNTGLLNNTGEIYIVVLQPDGSVLQKSTWESGAFQTADGKKIYSMRMQFDYNKEDTKRLTFSLTTENFMKGDYKLQVYCKGQLIGKFVKPLS